MENLDPEELTIACHQTYTHIQVTDLRAEKKNVHRSKIV